MSLFLGDPGVPVLLHHRVDDDIEHRVPDILLDEGVESGFIEPGRVDGGLVRIGFTRRDGLRAINHPQGRQKPEFRKSNFQTSEAIRGDAA